MLFIGREALANAFRHAGASKVEVEICYGDLAVTLRVRDNGQGIDAQVLRGGRPGHWGLLGMRERAMKIRANLDIWSKPGAGTEVELRLPARLAYQKKMRTSRRAWWRAISSVYSLKPGDVSNDSARERGR